MVLGVSWRTCAEPVPLSGIAVGEVGALLTSIRLPAELVPEVGVKFTVKAVDFPGANVSGKARPLRLNPVPGPANCVTLRLAPPTFVRVTVCELVWPTVTVPKLTAPGATEICGWTPIPLSATVETDYRRTLQPDRRVLLEQFDFADMARKVVGVGSVGTRCWIVLMLGRDENDPLFLQVKEAEESVLAAYAGRSTYTNEGERVVNGQRLMQATSDIFLGWQRNPVGLDDGRAHDFYVRQLRDWKFSLDVGAMVPRGLRLYGEVCGYSLARAHARSGDEIAIASYLGNSVAFDNAIAEFAAAYADQNERDFKEFTKAIADGRLQAERGV